MYIYIFFSYYVKYAKSHVVTKLSFSGASPFATGLSALPFGHLAHLPGAFSMLGHPAFPVSTLFGRLGDGLSSPLGSPGSLPTSLTSSSGKFLTIDRILF